MDAGTEPNDIPGVLDALARVEADAVLQPRGQNDGVACFNRLYQIITTAVKEGIPRGDFPQGAEFIRVLDVMFARRYLEALAAYAAGTRPSGAWRILIRDRSKRHIHPMQYAAAGVNAHVNLDLAVAVVNTCRAMNTRPEPGPNHQGYQAINRIFARNMQGLRESYEGDPAIRHVDRIIAPVMNMVDDMAVEGLRDLAWGHAQHLWTLRDKPDASRRYIAGMDRHATCLGAAVLIHL